MVCVAAEEHVVRRRLRALCRRSVVGILLLAREHVCVGERSLLEDCQIVPRFRAVVPGVVFRLLPSVERHGKSRYLAVPDLSVARAYLGKHEERAAVACCFVGLGSFCESRVEHLVESQTCNVAAGVDTESVNTHLDEVCVAVDKIVGSPRVLGVQVHAVAGNLCPPAGVVVPVELSEVVPEVVDVVVFIVGVLHLAKTSAVLFT